MHGSHPDTAGNHTQSLNAAADGWLLQWIVQAPRARLKKNHNWMALAGSKTQDKHLKFKWDKLEYFWQVCRFWSRPTAATLVSPIVSNFLNSLEIKALLNWRASGHHCLSFVLFPPVDSLLTISASFTSLHRMWSWLLLLFFLSPPWYLPKLLVSVCASQLLPLQFATWATD